MKITTKFKIWDTVWTIKDNKAYSFKIYKIEISVVTQPQWHIYSHIYYLPSQAWICNTSPNNLYKEDKLVWCFEDLITLL